ncbi:transcriptional regulator [Ursidibacter arcticus]
MKIQTEKEKFSERLKLAISSAYSNPMKTSEIATKFNLQHKNEAVTPQAVHKWLHVTPEWLRYGYVDSKPYSATDDVLIGLIGKLSDEQKNYLIGFINSFYKS